MTAVEWLYEQMFDQTYSAKKQIEWFEQAKEMEKQQIIDTVISCASFIGYEEAEQFYNITFKK